MTPNEPANDNLVDRTRAVWEPRLGRSLQPDEAKRMIADMSGFFALLAEWARTDPGTAANDNGCTAPEDGGANHDR